MVENKNIARGPQRSHVPENYLTLEKVTWKVKVTALYNFAKRSSYRLLQESNNRILQNVFAYTATTEIGYSVYSFCLIIKMLKIMDLTVMEY